jgi:putative Ca2+/H+ antiporter (TMEM165/GDT1 family)
MRLFATVFGSIFLAELGDKTQLATLLYASGEGSSKVTVFLGSALALVLSSAIGVAAGSFLSEHVGQTALRWIAGVAFIAIGVWTLART